MSELRRRDAALTAAVTVSWAAPALAELPASQAAVAYDDIAIVESTGTGWQTVLAKQIKTPNGKGLGVTVSLECGLTTRTVVQSKGGNKESAEADASVEVRLEVDGLVAEPGPVTFCRRDQLLSAKLGGILQDLKTADPADTCLELRTNPDGSTSVVIDEECVTPEEIELLLDTMGAHAYFFYVEDPGPGVHTVAVKAKVDTRVAVCEPEDQTCNDTNVADQRATATIGHGSMGIHVIRLVQGDDGQTLDLTSF
jgi:hypothetical protein